MTPGLPCGLRLGRAGAAENKVVRPVRALLQRMSTTQTQVPEIPCAAYGYDLDTPMPGLDADEVPLERPDYGLGQDGEAVFPAFAVAHRDLPVVEVEVLDSQA